MSALGLLPPGSPDDPHATHLVAPPAPAAPNFGFLYRPVGLSRREEDALRIHVLLLFYDDHALLWSSLEQHFHGLDEKRLNAAIAYLEQIDAVEVEPAPAPNPWSPDDALVRLIPHAPPFPPPGEENTSPLNRTLPLPWPGSHVYSPVVPATPGPPAFGFPVLLSETDYHAEQASEFPFPGSVSAGAAAFSSGRAGALLPAAGGRRRSGPGSRGASIPGLALTQVNPSSLLDQGSQTPRATLSATPTTSTPAGISTFPPFDVRLLPNTTVTPPSSDRWMSEENSPWLEAVDDADERGWMNKRLGDAMSGVDYLDLDDVKEQAGAAAHRGDQESKTVSKSTIAAATTKTTIPVPSHGISLSFEQDETLDIVERAMATSSRRSHSHATAASSSRTSSKKGRERTGLGVSFADTDEINEFHPPRSYERNHAEWEDDIDQEDAAGHAKTPIPNPGGGWMRRLEKAYSYG